MLASLLLLVVAAQVSSEGTCDGGGAACGAAVAEGTQMLQNRGVARTTTPFELSEMDGAGNGTAKVNGEAGEDAYLSELTLLAGSADDNVNLKAEALEELGWTPGVMIADTTHKKLGMLDHAWTFSKGGKCVAVFAATNDALDVKQAMGGLVVEPIEFCGFQVHAGVVDELAGFMKAPNWTKFITFLNSPTCTSVTSVGHSLGGALATVFAGCANVGAMNGTFGPRTDYGLVTFAPFAVSTSPMYSGTPGTPFNGMRYGITATDGGASSKTSLPEDTKQFRLDLLKLFLGIATATQNPAKQQLEQAYTNFDKLPADQIEPAWGGIESSLYPFLLPTFQIATAPPPGLEPLQSEVIATLTRMGGRGELFYSYDPISSLSNYFGFKHALVDFQPLPSPLKDGIANSYAKVDAASAPELPKHDAFQLIFGILGNQGHFPNHMLCCYSTASDCSSKFTVPWKACTGEPWR